MGTKSLTGSRKVVEVLNRFTQCNNYDAVEEYETQLDVTISEKETSMVCCENQDWLLGVHGTTMLRIWKPYLELALCMTYLVSVIKISSKRFQLLILQMSLLQ